MNNLDIQLSYYTIQIVEKRRPSFAADGEILSWPANITNTLTLVLEEGSPIENVLTVALKEAQRGSNE